MSRTLCITYTMITVNIQLAIIMFPAVVNSYLSK